MVLGLNCSRDTSEILVLLADLGPLGLKVLWDYLDLMDLQAI